MNMSVDGLAVPVVDLLDVPEDDLVFSSHVLWNPSDLQPGHEALRQTDIELQLNVHVHETPPVLSCLTSTITPRSFT